MEESEKRFDFEFGNRSLVSEEVEKREEGQEKQKTNSLSKQLLGFIKGQGQGLRLLISAFKNLVLGV